MSVSLSLGHVDAALTTAGAQALVSSGAPKHRPRARVGKGAERGQPCFAYARLDTCEIRTHGVFVCATPQAGRGYPPEHKTTLGTFKWSTGIDPSIF